MPLKSSVRSHLEEDAHDKAPAQGTHKLWLDEMKMKASTIVPSEFSAKKGMTAIMLIDFQNDLAKPGGSLHHDVAAVMIENDMIRKVQQVVETARYVQAICFSVPFHSFL